MLAPIASSGESPSGAFSPDSKVAALWSDSFCSFLTAEGVATGGFKPAVPLTSCDIRDNFAVALTADGDVLGTAISETESYATLATAPNATRVVALNDEAVMTIDGNGKGTTVRTGSEPKKVTLGTAAVSAVSNSSSSIVLGTTSGELVVMDPKSNETCTVPTGAGTIRALGCNGGFAWVVADSSDVAKVEVQCWSVTAAPKRLCSCELEADGGVITAGAASNRTVAVVYRNGTQCFLKEISAARTTSGQISSIVSAEPVEVPLGTNVVAVAPAPGARRRRWLAFCVERGSATVLPISLNGAPAVTSTTLAQRISAADESDLPQCRVECDAATSAIATAVAGLRGRNFAANKSRDVLNDILSVQSAALALAEREERQVGSQIANTNSAAAEIRRALHLAYVRRAATHLLGTAGALQLNLGEYIAERRTRRTNNLERFRGVFTEEFNVARDPNINDVTEMVRWEPRGLCLEALLSRAGIDPSTATVDSILTRLTLPVSGTEALLVLYLALCGSRTATEECAEFIRAAQVPPGALGWATAAFAADSGLPDVTLPGLDSSSSEGMEILPHAFESLVDADAIEPAYCMISMMLHATAPDAPIGEKFVMRAAYVAYHKGNESLLSRLLMLGREASWRPIMIKVAVHAAVQLKSLELVESSGLLCDADANAVLRELRLVDKPSADRLAVSYLIGLRRYVDALAACKQLSSSNSDDAHRTQVILAHLHTLVTPADTSAAAQPAPSTSRQPASSSNAAPSGVMRVDNAARVMKTANRPNSAPQSVPTLAATAGSRLSTNGSLFNASMHTPLFGAERPRSGLIAGQQPTPGAAF